MARTYTPQDASALMTLLVKEATGQDVSINEADTSDFISAGELVLSTGVENTINSLAIVLGRTMCEVDKYESKLKLIAENDASLYGIIAREILVYSRNPQEAGDWNTDQNTNFAPGYDNGTNSGNSVGTMWEQNPAVTKEMYFGGQSVWDDSTTIYENQLQVAFHGPDEFMAFASAILDEKENDFESQKEGFRRAVLLNYIGGIMDASTAMPGSAKNMTVLFNAKFGTSYTTQQLQTTYLQEFLQFFVATLKLDSKRLSNRTVNYHWTPAKTVSGVSYSLLRSCPKNRQKLIAYAPMLIDAEAQVFSTVFNPEYLSIDNYEAIDFWQNENDPMAIDVTPAIPDFAGTNSGAQTVGDEVEADILAVLFDDRACKAMLQFDSANTTPVEARKRYHNIWWHTSKNGINNFTRPGIVYYMADPAPEPDPGT